jgi:Na+/melibiose symporter-like transporter
LALLRSSSASWADLITRTSAHGSYFAAWTFVTKLAGGVMVFLAGQVLEVMGSAVSGVLSPFRAAV